jgi:ATP-dependent DNA helicase PIF1
LIKHVLKKEGTFVTASTGIAAVNISGTTLHSFSGIGLGKDSQEKLAKDISDNKMKREKWQNAKVLIIDEISMIDGNLFDKIEYVARVVRKSSKPFGGLQLLLSGDFLQLPPVDRVGGKIKFCFMAQSWSRVVNEVVVLDRVFRQNSNLLVDNLNELRLGKVTPASIKMFTECVNRKFEDNHDGIEPTVLFPLKIEVKEINDKKLSELPGPPAKTFSWKEYGNQGPLDALKKNCNAVQDLLLKVHTQVMLIKNLNPLGGLVNGSRGVVVGFARIGDDVFEYSAEYDKKMKAGAGPGSTSSVTNAEEKKVEEKVEKSLEEEQQPSDDEYDDDDTASDDGRDQTLYPIVQFAKGGPRMLIVPDKWETKVQGKMVAKLVQIPLIHGWSLTMHKCQGMTLDRVEMSMKHIFEYAQAYVAFSRVRAIEDLRLLDFNAHVIRAHPAPKNFYEELIKEFERLTVVQQTTTDNVGDKSNEENKTSTSATSVSSVSYPKKSATSLVFGETG